MNSRITMTKHSIWNPLAMAMMPACSLLFSSLASAVEPPAEPMSVWFTEPANAFHGSCPLGNGRLGAMDLGGVDEWRIILNESSVWPGGPYESNKTDA